MQVGFQLTKKDLVEFNYYHVHNTRYNRMAMILLRYFVMTPVFVLAFLPVFDASTSNIVLASSIAAYLLWVLLFPNLYKALTRMGVRKLIRYSNHANKLGPQSTQLTEDGIINASQNEETLISYDAITEIIDTKRYVFIYLSPTTAHIIPTRAFSGPDQKTAFLNELNHLTYD